MDLAKVSKDEFLRQLQRLPLLRHATNEKPVISFQRLVYSLRDVKLSVCEQTNQADENFQGCERPGRQKAFPEWFSGKCLAGYNFEQWELSSELRWQVHRGTTTFISFTPNRNGNERLRKRSM